jgi:hypothetical protein
MATAVSTLLQFLLFRFVIRFLGTGSVFSFLCLSLVQDDIGSRHLYLYSMPQWLSRGYEELSVFFD